MMNSRVLFELEQQPESQSGIEPSTTSVLNYFDALNAYLPNLDNSLEISPTKLYDRGDFLSTREIVLGSVSGNNLNQITDLPGIKAVWDDPEILPMNAEDSESGTVQCGLNDAIGNSDEVVSAIGCQPFWKNGVLGSNTVIAICDNGVDKSKFPVIDGWSPAGTEPWGEVQNSPAFYHGSMVSHAALLSAPEAKILDIGVLKYPNADRGAWLSNAIEGINWVVNWQRNNPEYRVVINNSWSTYRRLSTDLPTSVGSFANSKDHPFNERLEVVARSGIPIIFACGNCGDPCPDLRCGDNDRGPGNSIWGAASLENVISVAAVDLTRQRLPYSSQGPGAIHYEKPDFACFSHFKGYLPIDPGTSTASPVLSGLISLMLSLKPDISSTSIRNILKESCESSKVGWDSGIGYGVPSGEKVFELLNDLVEETS